MCSHGGGAQPVKGPAPAKVREREICRHPNHDYTGGARVCCSRRPPRLVVLSAAFPPHTHTHTHTHSHRATAPLSYRRLPPLLFLWVRVGGRGSEAAIAAAAGVPPPPPSPCLLRRLAARCITLSTAPSSRARAGDASASRPAPASVNRTREATAAARTRAVVVAAGAAGLAAALPPPPPSSVLAVTQRCVQARAQGRLKGAASRRDRERPGMGLSAQPVVGAWSCVRVRDREPARRPEGGWRERPCRSSFVATSGSRAGVADISAQVRRHCCFAFCASVLFRGSSLF